jgi:hypothetical protein
MYVYKRTEFSPYCLYTVGYHEPDGKWIPESDHDTKEAAAKRVAWLNGNRHPLPSSIVEALNSGDGVYRP